MSSRLTTHIKFFSIFVLILAALLAGFYGYRKSLAANDTGSSSLSPNPAATSEGAPNSVAAAGAVENITPSGAFEPYALLNSGRSLDEALKVAISTYGPKDGRAAALATIGESVCLDDPDPVGALRSTGGDPTRSWAIERLLSLCEGFDPAKYKFEGTGPDLAGLLKKKGIDHATSEAFRALKDSTDQRVIYEAGQVLLEAGRFPLAEVLPAGKERYGTVELMTAWSHAATLTVCNEGGGCGPQSLYVAAFCSNAGCRPDSDLASAYEQRLPRSDYLAMIAFYRWLSTQRK